MSFEFWTKKNNKKQAIEMQVFQYFPAIAREQSIIRAAESLHLSQPTLSTQIKNMEAELVKIRTSDLPLRSSESSISQGASQCHVMLQSTEKSRNLNIPSILEFLVRTLRTISKYLRS